MLTLYSIVYGYVRNCGEDKNDYLSRADFEKNYNLSNAYSHKYAPSNVLECGHCGTRYRSQMWTARGKRWMR